MRAVKFVPSALKNRLAGLWQNKARRAFFHLAVGIVAALSFAPALWAQTFTPLHSFVASGGGDGPRSSLVLLGNTLFGTTAGGDTFNGGTVFSVKTNGTGFAFLHSFSVSDGANPLAGLVLSGTTLYGTTGQLIASNGGTVFSVNTDGSGFTTLYQFPASPFATPTSGPMAGLTLSGQTLFGTTAQLTNFPGGTLFALSTNGSGFTNIHAFAGFPDDGDQPQAGVILAGNTLYGTTVYGGSDDLGSVYSVNTDGTGFALLASFSGGANGSGPSAGLVLVGGTLYGTTAGINQASGTIFAVNTNGSGFTTLHTFNSSGGAAISALIASGNTLFGTTENGGTIGAGTIYSINTNGSGFTNLYNFADTADGIGPEAAVILGGNALYGTVAGGGNGQGGTAFSFTLPPASGPVGALQVMINPSDAVAAGAEWLLDGGAFETNGATLTNLPIGNHTVSFNSINGWITPANQTVTVTANATNTITGTYTTSDTGPVAGYLTVTLTPAAVVDSGAQWSVDFGPLQDSGDLATNLSAGDHTLTFTDVSGWGTPAEQIVTVTSGVVTEAVGYYTALGINSLTVIIQPPGASAAGGGWQVDDGANQTSGATVQSLVPGDHTLSFIPIPGWITPTNQTITISNGANVTTSGVYVISGAATDGVILLTNGAGKIRTSGWPKNLILGKQYTVVAMPATKNAFSNWMGGTNYPLSILTTSPSYTFTMQSNLALEANFGTNIFLTAQGTYTGLFRPALAVLEQDNSGAFTFALSSTGKITGKISEAGQVLPMTGQFGLNGTATVNSTRKNSPYSLTSSLLLNMTNQTVTGTVSDDTFLANLRGDKDVFSNSYKATAFQGQYNMIIPGTTNPLVGPYGTSYSSVKVDAMGKVTMAGSLADGTSISQSSILSSNGYWPFYVSLYGGTGSLSGWLLFTNQGIMASNMLAWINPGEFAKATLYQDGFTNQETMPVGELYQPSEALPAGLTAFMSGGDLLSPVTVTDLANNAYGLTLRTNKQTGVVTGSFSNPDNVKQKIKFTGVVLQGETNAQGYFNGASQSGSFSLSPPSD